MPDFDFLDKMSTTEVKTLIAQALLHVPFAHRPDAIIEGYPRDELEDLLKAIQDVLEEVNEDDDPEAEEEKEEE